MGDQKRKYSQDGSTKTPDNHKVAAMSGSSNKQVTRPLSHGIFYKEAKTSKTILLEEVTPLRHRVRSGASRYLDASFHQNDQKNVLPPLIARASAKESPAGSSRNPQILSELHRGSIGADVHSSPSTRVTKGKNISRDKNETTQKIKDNAAFCSPSEIRGADLQEQNLPLVLAIDPDGKFLNGHASQACWKGTFEVLDVINIQYSEIQAYFPHMVCSKVYEIRRHLPEKIKFRLLPLRKVWPRIFQADPPTKDDVGLYFFPCEEVRHKEKYVRFIERLHSRSLAMQTCVNGVHLLLFTSKQLPLESQGIDAEVCLWGIFRNVKSKNHNQDTGIQSHIEDMRNQCAQLNVPCGEIVEEVDMEIDMVGGKEIGRIDVPIKKTSWSSDVRESNARDLNCAKTPPLKKVTDLIHPDVPPVISKLKSPALPKLPNSELQSCSSEATPKKLVSPIHPDAPSSFVELEPPRRPQVPIPRQQSLHGANSKVAGNHIHPDIPPGFGKLERLKCPKLLTSEQQSPPEARHNEVGTQIYPDVLPDFAELGPPGFAELRASKQQSLLGSPSKEAVRPIHPKVPPGFAELRPPGSLEYQAPKHESSSSVATSNASFSLRMDVIGNLAARNERDRVATVPESREIQSKHRQASELWDKSAKHPGAQVCQHTKENEKVRSEQKGGSLDNQLALASEDYKSTSGSPEMLPLRVQAGNSGAQRSRRVVSHNLACKGDNQGTEKTQNHGVMCGESTRVCVVSNSRSSISVSPHSAAHVLKKSMQKRSLSSDNSFKKEEMEGVKKMKGSTKPVPKKLGSVPSVCETESSTPGPGLPETSKDQNEKGRWKEGKVFGCSSKESMEGIENSHEMLDLNNVPNLVSKVSSVSDTQSSTLQPPLSADQIVSDEAQKRSLASDNSFADIVRMQKLCELLSENKQPDLITLSSDIESSCHIPALPCFSMDQHAKGRQEEEEVSECTSKETKEVRENTESYNTVDLKLYSENCKSPACSLEPILSPITPALQLFPEAVETIRAHEVEGRTELGIGRSLHLVSPEISLSRPQYVRDRNTWIPKSVRERLKRDGCGKELRLSL